LTPVDDHFWTTASDEIPHAVSSPYGLPRSVLRYPSRGPPRPWSEPVACLPTAGSSQAEGPPAEVHFGDSIAPLNGALGRRYTTLPRGIGRPPGPRLRPSSGRGDAPSARRRRRGRRAISAEAASRLAPADSFSQVRAAIDISPAAKTRSSLASVDISP